ncbi:MAG: response regulator [Desulfobacterales bacterium]|nr:response regulator [Desulfobacterales bacterium]
MSKPAILCVDDEQIVLVGLKQQLKRHFKNEFILEIAESGEEALEIIEELMEENAEIPVLISDQIMPGMKGDELMKQAHTLSPKTLKILLTGQADAAAVGSAVNSANLYRYIAKPWDQTDLIMTVSEAVRSYSQDKKLEEQNRILKTLNASYERFVPKEFQRFLNKKSIVDIQLGDHISKEMTVFFADIRSFTALSETMTPKENFDFVNAYLKRVSPLIRNGGGFIIKYLGDGMMGVFPDSADDAVIAGNRMLEQVAVYNEDRRKKGYEPIKIGYGLHTGHMMVGMVGELHRMQGDAFSDNVNLASRVEGMTKMYDTSFLITEQTLQSLEDPGKYRIRMVDNVRAQGKNEPVTIYEVFDTDPGDILEQKLQTLADFNQALDFFREARFAEALGCFSRVLCENANDKAAQVYVQRCARFLQEGVPENWAGVETLKRK